MAARIELGARVRVSRVQRNYLVTDKVIPRRDALGHCIGNDTASFHQGSGTPSVRSTSAAGLLNLEPDSATIMLAGDAVT